ncbi:MFS transporter [Paenibacillus sp. NPDC058174]|uniref:MFS transporter n=1 Tax=Paenibacillus sp. NPDC058174 TaxID=3346366 RepID=UPI0036DF7FB2
MTTESDKLSKSRLNWMMGALLVTIFLTQLDQTIVSTALPTIVSKLQGFEHMSWVFTVYMLASTVMMPIAGKLSDLYGRKIFFMLGLLLFMGGSALCGVAGSMLQLVLYRGIQGIGAGFLLPVTFTLVFSIMPKERAGIYQTLYMGVFALSSVVGPALGAVITAFLDWRWIFFINLPFGIAIFFVMNRLLSGVKPNAGVKPSVDWAGAALLSVSTLALLLGLKMGGEEYGWQSVRVISLLALGAAAAVCFTVVQLRAKEPILPFELFRSKVISGTLMATFVQGIMMYGALVYIPLFVQGSLGGDVGDSGGALTPLMFCVMIGATFSSSLIKRWSWRFNIALSMLFTGAGLLMVIYMPYDVNPWLMRLIMALIGIGIGIMMMVGQMAVSMSADEQIKGVATSTVGFSRSIGGVFGTAVLTSIVNSRLSALLMEKAGQLELSPDGVERLADPQALLQADSGLPAETLQLLRATLGESVQFGFWFLVAAAVLGIAAAVWMGSARFEAGRSSVQKPEKLAGSHML